MNYEQQYPEVENFYDWNAPEPVDQQKASPKQGSLGLPPDPKDGMFSNKGRLRPDLYNAFDNLPFNPNILLRGDKTWGEPSYEQKQVAGLLGIKDLSKLNHYNSPESYFMTRSIMDWNARKNGMSMKFYEPPDPRMNDDLMKYVIDAEGDKAENHGWDYGKSTKFGISERDADRLGKYGLSTADIPNLTYAQAKKYFRDEYWSKSYAALPPPKDIQNKRLAVVLFDTAINGVSGIGKPLRAIYSDRSLTDDQKADAIMKLRLKLYKSSGSVTKPSMRDNVE